MLSSKWTNLVVILTKSKQIFSTVHEPVMVPLPVDADLIYLVLASLSWMLIIWVVFMTPVELMLELEDPESRKRDTPFTRGDDESIL